MNNKNSIKANISAFNDNNDQSHKYECAPAAGAVCGCGCDGAADVAVTNLYWHYSKKKKIKKNELLFQLTTQTFVLTMMCVQLA